MNVNIKEIAKIAGVSVATVSRALNNKGPIRVTTRQRIVQLAQDLNYQPSSVARSLSKRTTDNIGLVLPNIADELFSQIVRGIDTELHLAHKYLTVASLHSGRHPLDTISDLLNSGRVDGLIVMVSRQQQEAARLIQKATCPVVFINQPYRLNEGVSFNIDNYQGAFNVTEHLITGHGFKSISMLGGPEDNSEAEERLRGFKAALTKHNLEIQPGLIVPGDFTIKSGYYGFIRLMSQSEKPAAIFAANDLIAVGAYEAARNSNLNIPRDVAIVGFEDLQVSRFVKPQLTTVHIPLVELGASAVRYLLKMIKHEVDPSQSYNEQFSTGIVIGGSCGCYNYATPTIL